MAYAEQLWVDVTLRNPLNVPITLTGLTLLVENSNSEGSSNDLEVEVVEDIYLNAKELLDQPDQPAFEVIQVLCLQAVYLLVKCMRSAAYATIGKDTHAYRHCAVNKVRLTAMQVWLSAAPTPLVCTIKTPR